MQAVGSHMDIAGNEEADKAAKACQPRKLQDQGVQT